MRPIWTFAAATLAAAMMQTAQAADATPPTKPPSLYERIEEEMAARPDLAKQAGRPAKEMAQVAWLVGEWDVTANVFATRKSPAQTSKGRSRIANALGGTWLTTTDTYDKSGPKDLGYLTFNPVTRNWLSLQIDAYGDALIATADAWHGDKLVFELPNVLILDQRTTLRQTMEKRSNREFRILNEERLSDGTWIAVDEYIYRKR